MFSNTKKTAFIYSVIAVFLFILDIYLKSLALNTSSTKQLLGDFLKFNFAKNYFIAFSLPLGGKILLFIIVSILIYLVYYLYKLLKTKEYIQSAFLFAVILGAISNLVDRLRLGYVVDYLDMKYFTVFNVADCLIVCGVGLLLMYNYIFLNEKRFKT